MGSVWVVTTGCYSDFGIEGVFDTAEAAEAFAAKYAAGAENMEIKEWVLNELASHVPYIEVSMDRHGNVSRVYPVRHKVFGTVQNDYGPDWGGNQHYYVDTDEPDRAVKVANERRTARIIAGK